MRALKVHSPGHASVVSDVPKPSIDPGYILVKTIAVALNPTDWKHIGFTDKEATIGCDYAGIVEEVGLNVHRNWKRGDRVCGFSHGGNVSNLEQGAFADFLVAKADVQMRIPDFMSFEEAATLGVGTSTVGQGLYQGFKIPFPGSPAPSEKLPILVYGGSTATGALAIQFARLSGLEVLTTCSPRNFEYVKSLGADRVFDYSSPDVASQIREYTKNKLFWAYDTISLLESAQVCASALSSELRPDGTKPQYSGFVAPKMTMENIDANYTLAYTGIGEEFVKFGRLFEARPQDFEFQCKFILIAEKLYTEKKIKPHQHEVKSGGLDGILAGLDDMKNGKISGVKLVYRISE